MSGERPRVVVLMGGWSSEREVSLKSGTAVANALRRLPYDVLTVDPVNDLVRFAAQMASAKPDVVFNALHGTGGEDGIIQGALEMAGIPYTHSGVTASAVAMDKNLTKILVKHAGVRVTKDVVIKRKDLSDTHPLPLPYVVKPVADGSSVGVTIVKTDADRTTALRAGNSEQIVLVEQYIAGDELTVAVLDAPQPRALGVTRLVPKVAFYDYAAKYTAGVTDHQVNPDMPADLLAALQEAAVTAHRVLGCRDVSRSDFRYNPTDGVVFLEINTNPGMTDLSLVPEQAAAAGISFDALVDTLVKNALARAIVRSDDNHRSHVL